MEGEGREATMDDLIIAPGPDGMGIVSGLTLLWGLLALLVLCLDGLGNQFPTSVSTVHSPIHGRRERLVHPMQCSPKAASAHLIGV